MHRSLARRSGHGLRGGSQFQLHQDHVDQGRDRRTTGLDHMMRRLSVQRVPHRIEIPQPLQGIVHLQQGPRAVVAQPPMQFLGRGTKVENPPPTVQPLPIRRSQHRAAARGQHARLPPGQLVDHGLLDIAEGVLALPLEELADGAADAIFDHLIGIDEGHLQPPRELPADRGLAGAGKAD